jgi:hypothetical protein
MTAMARAHRHAGGAETVLYGRFIGPYPGATPRTAVVRDRIELIEFVTGRIPTPIEVAEATRIPIGQVERHYQILRLPYLVRDLT